MDRNLMEATTTLVRPVSPPAPYIGGKRNLSRRICALIDEAAHDTYVEPFVGMGGVFLKRTRRPPVEVVNDISAEVTTLFRILQRHYPQFMEVLKWQITSRSEFERLLGTDPGTLTDLERAARFLYLQRLSFGGKVSGRSFGVDARSPARFDVTKLAPLLDELHERLAGVVIERLTYPEVIRRYDGPSTLFSLDPPYWGCENDYGPGVFGRSDFKVLAEQLSTIDGQFILTINANEESRKVFSRFQLDEVETTYTLPTAALGVRKRVTELIVHSIRTGPATFDFGT